jgi:hypothetical protein
MSAPVPKTTPNKTDERAVLSILVLLSGLVGALPYLIFGVALICSPAYFLPLLNHPVVRIICLVSVGWEALGMCLLIREAKKGLNVAFFLKMFAFVLIFVLPLIALQMLGPAVLTIMQALAH